MPDCKRILWLKTGPLHPLDTGGKLRTFHILRELSQRLAVTYLALCPEQTGEEIKAAAGKYSQNQVWVPWRERPKGSGRFYFELLRNWFSAYPYVIEKYRSMAMARRTLELAGRHDLIVCDFLTPAVNLFSGGRVPGAPTLLFQHNVESLIWQRLHENTAGWIQRRYFHQQWRRMVQFERSVAARFSGVVGVSEADCALMRDELHLRNVLGSVPTGVDVEYFRPPTGARPPYALVFLGSMDWMPNIDAMEYFTTAIYPKVKARFPETTLAIVGRNPTARVRALAQGDRSIQVTGTVDDVRPFLAAAGVMIVPLRIGGGTRIKIYEGLATGIPVVSTRIGAEGLNVQPEEHILLADTPDEFAAAVGRLFEQPAVARRLGDQGLDLVRQHFRWAKVTDVFENYCQQICRHPAIGV